MNRYLFNRIFLSLLAASFVFAADAHASDYPSKLIRIVVPWTAGTGTDINARNIGQQITAATGQPVVIDNRAGAGGMVGTAEVLRSPADGYTVLATSNAHIANLLLVKNLPYDPLNDFIPVGGTRKLPSLMIASPRLGVKNLAELTALAKRNPGKISFGAGNSAARIGMELYQQMANVKLLHVPYKSATAALNDLLGGHVDVMYIDLVNSITRVKAGNVVPLAAGGKTRLKALPDLPTAAEQGLAGFDVTSWTGLWVRKGTPPEAVSFLNKFANKTAEAEKENLEATGGETFITTPEEFAHHIESDLALWKRTVAAANIVPE
jgi:tripartite-type tricarboxylate transporter receptor subunit TctC